MGLADDFERRLEQVVEGFFSKAFRSRVEPAEVGRRLLREMEGGKSISVGAIYVPNRYTVRLAPSDYSRFEGLAPTLRKDFSQLLSEAARDRRWKLPGAMVVAFQGDDGVKEGRFEVDALHDPSAQSPETDAAPAKLSRKDGDRRQDWVLEGDEVIVGRQETCDIVIENPNASRRHARLTRREDGWWIADMGAVNGTLVNGSLVKEKRLRAGDRIQIGTTELEYQDSAPEASG